MKPEDETIYIANTGFGFIAKIKKAKTIGGPKIEVVLAPNAVGALKT